MSDIQIFRQRLNKLESMLSKLNSKHPRVRQLKRSVYVLQSILNDERLYKSAYGPDTPMGRFSIN